MGIFRAKRSCCSAAELNAKTYLPRKCVAKTSVRTIKRSLPIKFFVLGVVICALAIPLAIMLGIRENTSVAEWWTRNIQAGWERAIGTLTSWLPFSVFELFIVIGIIIGVYLFVRLFVNLCTGRFRRILLGVLSLVVVAVYVLNLYVLSMGFGYYRAAMPLPQAGSNYTKEQAIAATEYFAADYRELAEKLQRDDNGCVVCPYSFDELTERIAEEYARIDNDYFAKYTPRAKPVFNSAVMSSMLITGITFLPFGEATVNTAAPPTVITYTMAHELAHTKGIQREGDANLMAYFVLLSSDDEYLRYCGYYEVFYSLPSAMLLFDDREEYERLSSSESPLVYIERGYARKYWTSQWDVIGDISEFFNDLYLTLNGALNGIGSYGDGNKSDVIITIKPDGEQHREIIYSQIQKMFFALYEMRI